MPMVRSQIRWQRLGILIIGGMLAIGMVICCPAPTWAALKCQTIDHHRVCLESIKRSAKYFWQYRAVVSVDGQFRPEQRYDCRSRPVLADPTQDALDAKLRQLVCQIVP